MLLQYLLPKNKRFQVFQTLIVQFFLSITHHILICLADNRKGRVCEGSVCVFCTAAWRAAQHKLFSGQHPTRQQQHGADNGKYEFLLIMHWQKYSNIFSVQLLKVSKFRNNLYLIFYLHLQQHTVLLNITEIFFAVSESLKFYFFTSMSGEFFAD